MGVSTDEAPVAWEQLEKELTHSNKKVWQFKYKYQTSVAEAHTNCGYATGHIGEQGLLSFCGNLYFSTAEQKS